MPPEDDRTAAELLRRGAGELELPQTADGLLRRLTEGYEQLLLENRELRATVERLESNAAGPSGVDLSRTDADELAHVLLAAAQRAARELRESTRLDCELMLRKAGSRARKLERDLTTAQAAANAELEALETLRREVRDRMRSSLETLNSILPEDTFVARSPETKPIAGNQKGAAPLSTRD